MPRIPQAELDRLKSEISIVRLVEAYGVKLTRKGKDFHGLCPLHDDREPSLVVSEEKNLWNCLGACQTGGTTIDWVMKAYKKDFLEAVKMLQGEFSSLGAGSPVPAPAKSSPAKPSLARKFSPLAGSNLEDQDLLSRVVRYYHEVLKVSERALG